MAGSKIVDALAQCGHGDSITRSMGWSLRTFTPIRAVIGRKARSNERGGNYGVRFDGRRDSAASAA
jgi:hypothetical protein